MSLWKEYRVKNVAKRIGSGTTPNSSNEKYYDNGIFHWINTGDFNNSDIYRGKQMITERALNEVPSLRFYPIDTVLVAMYGASIGKIGLLKVKATVNQACCAIVPNRRICLSRYLFYVLMNNKDSFLQKSFGGTQPNISQMIVSNLICHIPSLSEQQRIVDYLDEKLAKIDERIEVLEKQQDAYARLKKSVINQAVTRGLDPDVRLKDSGIEWIGKIPEHWERRRLKDFSVLNPQYVGKDKRTEVSFLPMEGLRYDSTTLQSIPFEEGKGKYTFFADGDLLIAKVTPCFENGNIAIARDLKEGIGFGSSEIFVLRLDRSVSSRFFFYYVLAPSFQDEACSTMCGVGGLKRISPFFMRTRLVFLPPLPEQQAIASYLDEKCAKIDAAIENIGKQIDASKRLKRALINEVITGQRAV